MDLHLTNKVVIVTGGAKGIGESICLVLAEEGALPVIMDKDEEAGKSLQNKIGGKSIFIPTDLTSPDSCKQAIGKIISQTGAVHALVNNAGVNDGIGLENGSPDKFLTSLNNNAGHYYFMAHYTLPYLKKSKGNIINIGSKTSLTGQGNTSGYVAAKGAILSLTREWAVELLPYGIRVNAVIPAEVWTPMYESWMNSQKDPEKKLESISKTIPFENRLTTSKEIADTVVFLLSSRASHITGQWIHVDGGYVHLDRSIDSR